MRLPWQKRSPDLTIAPSIPEWQDHPADYEGLVEAVGSLGLRARLAENKPPHSGADIPEFIPLGFAIYIGTKIADKTLDSLLDLLKRLIIDRARTRWWTRGKRVKGVIYGPNNEILREVMWVSKNGERQDREAGE